MTDTFSVEPMDTFNKTLVASAHPDGWINPEPDGRYNMVVIGAGTAGLVTAAGTAGLGGKVALIERGLMGGDCLNTGCVPSKCVIRSSRAAHEVRNAAAFGIRARDVEVDFAAVMERMRRIRSRVSAHDAAERFRDKGVDVFLGEGRFVGEGKVEVAGKTLEYARACIATGARALALPIDGLAEAGYLTNETVFSLTERPRRLAVIGGGPIGCELGQAFARLGCEVTICERAEQLLSREEHDVSAILAGAMERDGVHLRLGYTVSRIERRGDEKVVHMDSDKHGRFTVTVDEILVALGRVPNVEGLGLETVGVEFDERHGVTVNDRLQTTNPRIYAAGDVCMAHKFTHAADAAARIVIQNAMFFGRKRLSAQTIPWCTYTDPEVAHVGLSPVEAHERGIEVLTFTETFDDLDRAMADGQECGLARIHVRKGSGRIVGATIVAAHAGEMISEITVAMVGGLSLGALAGVIHPYPTQAEVIKHLADAYRRTTLGPRTARLLKKVLAWRR